MNPSLTIIVFILGYFSFIVGAVVVLLVRKFFVGRVKQARSVLSQENINAAINGSHWK